MIGYLSGKVIAHLDAKIIVKPPSGVGYIVNVSPAKNYLTNENVDIFILEVGNKNDGTTELYAFDQMSDRECVEKLMKVDGIGPKMAAKMVYALGNQAIYEAIYTGSVENLQQVKGLGLKTAKKIILELKGGSTDLDSLEKSSKFSSSKGSYSQTAIQFTDALSNMGYKRGEIVMTITAMKKANLWNESEDIAHLVKSGLKLLSK